MKRLSARQFRSQFSVLDEPVEVWRRLERIGLFIPEKLSTEDREDIAALLIAANRVEAVGGDWSKFEPLEEKSDE